MILRIWYCVVTLFVSSIAGVEGLSAYIWDPHVGYIFDGAYEGGHDH
jgi:hypothetical protein